MHSILGKGELVTLTRIIFHMEHTRMAVKLWHDKPQPVDLLIDKVTRTQQNPYIPEVEGDLIVLVKIYLIRMYLILGKKLSNVQYHGSLTA